MPTRRLLLLSVLIGVVAFTGRPRAQGPAAAFHGVGQLAGARAASVIKDATKAGGVIYAVGGAAARACTTTSGTCGDTDTGVLWTSDTGILAPLPDAFPNTTYTTPVSAFAITPDAAIITSQARTSSTNPDFRHGVRVTRSVLSNQLLTQAQFSVAPGSSPFFISPPTAAVAVSHDGFVVYSSAGVGSTFPARGIRFDTVAMTRVLIPVVSSSSDSHNPVAVHGTSSSGHVAVGSSFGTPTNHKAYRYLHGTPGTVTAIPLLPGGAYNDAVAVSPDGDLVLVTGNSTAHPNGEAYFYRFSTGATQPLGSPNTPWSPGGRICQNSQCLPKTPAGGMTADGSVVAMNFSQQDGVRDRYAYIRNAHGWFHLTSVLLANGVDIAADGWEGLEIQGISADGTLVFGAGDHDGKVEGFVAEFGAGVLASFNPLPEPPADTSLVGVWSEDEVGDEDHFIVFMADGAYYQIEDGNGGFERGAYTFDGNVLTITTLLDTNGSSGLSDLNGSSTPITVNGDTAGDGALHRITGGPGSIVGGWVGGNPAEADNSNLVVFAGNTYGSAQDFPDDDESETGTYTWDAVSHQLNVFPTVGAPDLGNFVTLTPDGLGLHVVDDGGEEFDLTRVIDPATVPAVPVITNSPLIANGVAGQAFSYAVTATNAVSFGATGLPDGLSINPSTGLITGTPGAGGQFAVTISAANASGVSDIETLTLTIAIPTPVGQNVVVEPEVPEGQGPVTLSFGEITSAGTTTVTILDPSEVPAPGNVSIAGVMYEVNTTATYEGLITVCFSYAGIDFGDATPRLFHYEDNVWVDITTGVDPETETICGATTTLSPFAVLVSNVVRTGFYAPVNPMAGFLNTVKGGSTVPLKFNVSVNGVNQTMTAGMALTLQAVNCDSNAPEDPVEPAAVTGGTGLRYEGSNFIYNWKVPKSPGCYMIRMTTEQDGLALTARFKVK